MSNEADIGSLIVKSPDIRSAKARIAGTGVTVQRIVEWHKSGLSPEEIANEIGHLTLAQVFAALAYYHANRQEIESDIAIENESAEKLERKPSPLTDHGA